MNQKILIVEDQFIEANNLEMILKRAGYQVCRIARSVPVALDILEKEIPDLVLLDIYLKGPLTGIDLAKILRERNIAFVYLSANSTKEILDAAKTTRPYGFLVKPFREKDVLVTLDIARYLHQYNLQEEGKTGIINGLTTGNLKTSGRLIDQKNHLPDAFKEIIAVTPVMQKVLEQVNIVAASDTSVLILGETGTGKEGIADAIHQLSPRNKKPFIKINCAALPASLIESELFGHEKGAFTGAIEKRRGKFEQANEGTIFLDEIGDMPLDLQAKLLRVLQEKEIEPIGGKSNVKINVRVISATNATLEKQVATGKFRIDLYYRLNVFPISLPPLRERKGDIKPIAEHFIQHYARMHKKKITGMSDDMLTSLQNYQWPGNIRELKHFIERGVLLAKEEKLNTTPISLPANPEVENPKIVTPISERDDMKLLSDNERDHILAALRKSNGKIFGQGGAAEMLGLNASTLNSRIRKLGIIKKQYFSSQ